MTRILVTRPEPGAAATKSRLLALGFDPVMLPLTEIAALPVENLPPGEAVDAVAVTSANALRCACPGLIAGFRSKTCFAVGAQTAAAARNAGFADVVCGPGDAAGLARIVRSALPEGARVLHLCGHVRVGDLTQELQQAGIAVTELETYDAPAIAYTPAALLAGLGREGPDGALLHSAKSAARLAELAAWPQIRPLFAKTLFFCLSARIGAALKDIPKDRVFCATQPREGALMTLLRQLPAVREPNDR